MVESVEFIDDLARTRTVPMTTSSSRMIASVACRRPTRPAALSSEKGGREHRGVQHRGARRYVGSTIRTRGFQKRRCPKVLDGLFQGKNRSKMDDDWGTPILGKLHVEFSVLSWGMDDKFHQSKKPRSRSMHGISTFVAFGSILGAYNYSMSRAVG